MDDEKRRGRGLIPSPVPMEKKGGKIAYRNKDLPCLPRGEEDDMGYYDVEWYQDFDHLTSIFPCPPSTTSLSNLNLNPPDTAAAQLSRQPFYFTDSRVTPYFAEGMIIPPRNSSLSHRSPTDYFHLLAKRKGQLENADRNAAFRPVSYDFDPCKPPQVPLPPLPDSPTLCAIPSTTEMARRYSSTPRTAFTFSEPFHRTNSSLSNKDVYPYSNSSSSSSSVSTATPRKNIGDSPCEYCRSDSTSPMTSPSSSSTLVMTPNTAFDSDEEDLPKEVTEVESTLSRAIHPVHSSPLSKRNFFLQPSNNRTSFDELLIQLKTPPPGLSLSTIIPCMAGDGAVDVKGNDSVEESPVLRSKSKDDVDRREETEEGDFVPYGDHYQRYAHQWTQTMSMSPAQSQPPSLLQEGLEGRRPSVESSTNSTRDSQSPLSSPNPFSFGEGLRGRRTSDWSSAATSRVSSSFHMAPGASIEKEDVEQDDMGFFDDVGNGSDIDVEANLEISAQRAGFVNKKIDERRSFSGVGEGQDETDDEEDEMRMRDHSEPPPLQNESLEKGFKATRSGNFSLSDLYMNDEEENRMSALWRNFKPYKTIRPPDRRSTMNSSEDESSEEDFDLQFDHVRTVPKPEPTQVPMRSYKSAVALRSVQQGQERTPLSVSQVATSPPAAAKSRPMLLPERLRLSPVSVNPLWTTTSFRNYSDFPSSPTQILSTRLEAPAEKPESLSPPPSSVKTVSPAPISKSWTTAARKDRSISASLLPRLSGSRSVGQLHMPLSPPPSAPLPQLPVASQHVQIKTRMSIAANGTSSLVANANPSPVLPVKRGIPRRKTSVLPYIGIDSR